MASKGYKTVQGRRVRVTAVDSCGRPIIGPASQAVSKGFVSVTYTANTSDTDEINVTGADGQPGIYVPSQPQFNGYGVSIEFYEVDPELFSLITGQPVYLDADGNAIGLRVNSKIDLSQKAFGLELWAGSPSTDACVDPNAQGVFGYFLMPFLQGGILGDLTVENGAVSFTITGANTRDGNAWGSGPYNVMMGNNGTNEVQRLTVTGTPTGGTFTLGYGGQTTAPIAYNASAAVVQGALDLLTNLDPGDVVVTGGPLPGSFITITFGKRLANTDVAMLTVTPSFTGGTAPTATVTQQTAGVPRSPAPLITPLTANDHLLLIWVTVGPPDVFYGTRPVLDRNNPAVTNLTAAKGNTGYDAVFTITGPTTSPVFIDFGDGTWDYIAAGGSGASHSYAANGTYAVKASSNGVVRNLSLVIPIP